MLQTFFKNHYKKYALLLAMAISFAGTSHMGTISVLNNIYAAEEGQISDTDDDNSNQNDQPDNSSEKEDSKPIIKKTAVITGISSYNYMYTPGKTFYLGLRSSGNGRLTYRSNNNAVATVSANGQVITRGLGTCIITVYSPETSTFLATSKKIQITIWKRPVNLGYSNSYKRSKYYRKLASLKLYNNARNNLLTIASSQLGYHESSSRSSLSGSSKSSGNYTEYGRFYRNNGVPWCAIFVNWVARENGIRYNVVPKECAVRRYYSFYKKQKLMHSWSQVRTRKYRPLKGDIIFYSYERNGTTHHIGYVESCSYSGSKIILTVIEGNQKNAVRRLKMKVHSSNKSGKIRGMYIAGFGSPRY